MTKKISPIECVRVSKSFGGLKALTDISIQVNEGEILGIIGPNGAGKTTLFNVISGAIPPTGGEVFFRGRSLSGMDSARVCRLGIARTYQLVRPFHSLTTLENVLIGISFGRTELPPRDKRISEAMDILDFVGLAARANKVASELTLVEKKHLEIARALGTSPDVLPWVGATRRTGERTWSIVSDASLRRVPRAPFPSVPGSHCVVVGCRSSCLAYR